MVVEDDAPDSATLRVGSFISASAGEKHSGPSSAANADEVLATLGPKVARS
jgi:hypothetical protein